MNQHLSWQQISSYLIGDPAPEETRHARECAVCRAEIDRFERPLAWFQASVLDWSDRQRTAAFDTAPVLSGVARIRGFSGGHEKTAGAFSVLIHCAVVAVLVILGSVKPVQRLVRETVTLIAPDLKQYMAKNDIAHGGGGAARANRSKRAVADYPRSPPGNSRLRASILSKIRSSL